MTSVVTYRTTVPKFKRNKTLEECIGNGTSVVGVTGYTPATIECCSGSTRVYIPVRVKRIKIGDCSFSVIVETHAREAYQHSLNEFSVNPKNFFDSLLEAKEYEEFKDIYNKYRNGVKQFEYSNQTLTRCRNIFREELEKTTSEIREAILSEISDPDEGIKKADKSWMKDWYSVMLIAKLWPNAEPEDSNDEEDDEDWE